MAVVDPRTNTRQLLDDLSRQVEAAPLGAVTPDTIAPIFPFLDPARIPSSVRPSAVDRQTVALANAALFVLVACPEHMRASPALVARILADDGWPHVWKWIQFEHDKCIVEKVYGEDGSARAVFAISLTLEALARTTALRRAILSTPGVLVLLTRQWLQARPSALIDEPMAYSVALDIVLDPMQPALPALPQVLAGAGGDAKLVATTVLARLRSAMAAAADDQIGLHLSLVHNLSYISCQPLHLAFINHSVIPEMVKVLQWCNAHPPNARPINAMLLCYRNIFKGFHSANGSAWAVQALDSGLLTATLRACKWIDAAEHPELFGVVEKLLSDMLSKYLIFRSVLRVVRRCLRQVTKLGLGTKESAGALWGAWRVFQVLAEERLSLLDAWDRKGGRSERQLCSRLQCTRQDDEALKRCSGCLGPTYCSKECQRLSWPLHKRGCRESRQMLLDGLEMPRDKLDVSFIRFITKLEINRRLPKILRDALQAGVPRSTIVLDINHTVVPMTFTVKRVSDFGPPVRDFAAAYDWRDMLRRAEDSDGVAMAVRTIVPQDEVGEEWLMLLIDVEAFLQGCEEYRYETDHS